MWAGSILVKSAPPPVIAAVVTKVVGQPYEHMHVNVYSSQVCAIQWVMHNALISIVTLLSGDT